MFRSAECFQQAFAGATEAACKRTCDHWAACQCNGIIIAVTNFTTTESTLLLEASRTQFPAAHSLQRPVVGNFVVSRVAGLCCVYDRSSPATRL